MTQPKFFTVFIRCERSGTFESETIEEAIKKAYESFDTLPTDDMQVFQIYDDDGADITPREWWDHA